MTGEETVEPVYRRLHPLTIVQNGLGWITSNLIALAVMHFTLFEGRYVYTFLALIAILVGTTLTAWLLWSRFSWALGEEEIRIRSGLISRNNRSLPYERIQDVQLARRPLHRLLGLAAIRLETGASGGDDDAIDALKLEDARALRDRIRDIKAGVVDGAATDVSDIAEQRPPLFAMDSRRVLVAGLFNFSFILFAAVAALAQNADFLVDMPEFEIWYWISRLTESNAIDGLSLGLQIIGAIAVLVSIILVGVVSGIIRTFLREHGFRLDRVDNGFRRRRGLLTLTDMVMPIQRVQAALIKTGPIRERFGWYHLKFQSLASDAGGDSDHSAAPCARREEIDPILTQTSIRNVDDDSEFLSVDPAMWWRDALLFGLLLLAIGIGNGLFVHPVFFLLPLLALPLSGWMALNWRHHRYLLSGDQLAVRHGWWRRSLTLLPLAKVQTVDVAQGPTDHPLGLAKLVVGVAGGSSLRPLTIDAIPYDRAMQLRARLLAPVIA